MTPGDRYDRLVEQVADTGRIWLLEDEAGLVGSEDDEGRRYLAVWPDEAPAAACAVGAWKGARPVSMDVHPALETIAARDGMLAAYPTPDDEGVLVAAAELQRRLVD